MNNKKSRVDRDGDHDVDDDVAQDGDGWIYEKITEFEPFPSAKYILRRYNPKSGQMEYLGFQRPPFDIDIIKENYGAGQYHLEVRTKGQFTAKTDFTIARLTGSQSNAGQTSESASPGATVLPRGIAEDPLEQEMAKVLRQERILGMIERLRPQHKDNNGNGSASFERKILETLLTREFQKDGFNDFISNVEKVESLREMFGGNGRGGHETLEGAIADSIPELLDLFKSKKQSQTKGVNQVDDLTYVVNKIYQMAVAGEDPRRGVSLMLSVLPASDIKMLNNATVEQVINNLSGSFPKMKPFLTGEKGMQWITEFKQILKDTLSMMGSPAQNKKSESSGKQSAKDGETQPSSEKPKTSSDSPGQEITTRKPGQSTNGLSKTPGIRRKG